MKKKITIISLVIAFVLGLLLLVILINKDKNVGNSGKYENKIARHNKRGNEEIKNSKDNNFKRKERKDNDTLPDSLSNKNHSHEWVAIQHKEVEEHDSHDECNKVESGNYIKYKCKLCGEFISKDSGQYSMSDIYNHFIDCDEAFKQNLVTEDEMGTRTKNIPDNDMLKYFYIFKPKYTEVFIVDGYRCKICGATKNY